MDRVTAAEVFVDLAYSGSFTATAQRLDMSRPMVTRYIETMEGWLAVRLFHRTTRKVTLTSAGEHCLKDVEAWLEAAHQLVSNANPSGELSDAIRIAVSPSFGYAHVAPALVEFMALHPRVSVDVDLEDTAVDLVEQRIDLAIRIASNPNPSLIGKPIAQCRSVIVASPSYLARSADIRSPEDLVSHDCLGHKYFERNVWHLSRGDQHVAISVGCRLSANETSVLMQAAIQGAGVALLPTYLANQAITEGKLQPVLPGWQPPEMRIYGFYSSRKHLSPTVRALIDFMADYYAQHPWD